MRKTSLIIFMLFFMISCIPNINPTGSNLSPNYPYFVTIEPTFIKKILVPVGTKLTYEEHFFKEGQQNKMLNEKKLTQIELKDGATIDWGGIPVYRITKFFNTDISGFSVYAKFDKLRGNKRAKLFELWSSCSKDLDITVKNTDDWSFNKENISDVLSCGVLYQRYFKEDKKQQLFLDKLYSELIAIDSN